MNFPLDELKKQLPLRAVNVSRTGHHGKIGSIVEILPNADRLGWRGNTNTIMYFDPDSLQLVRADNSIADGYQIAGSVIQVIHKSKTSWCPRSAVGHYYRIKYVNDEGVTVEVDDAEYGDHYFIPYGDLEIVPNYIEGFRLNTKKELVKDTLTYSHYDGNTVKWKTSNGTYITDSLVFNNITDALDMARRHNNLGTIKVHR